MFTPSIAQAQETIENYGSPIFITDADTIRAQAKMMLSAFAEMNMKMFYAVKANFNPHVVKVIKEAGIYGIDAVSPNEVKMALDLGYTPEQIIFTPSNPTDSEIKEIGDLGVLQNLDSLSGIDRFGKMFPGQAISVRICPEVGEGECDKVNTGGLNSKFGITLEDVETLREVCQTHDLKLVGIHSHIGSGFYNPDNFATSVQAVCDVAAQFESIEFVDFGGGFGIEYDLNKAAIDISRFADPIKPIIADYQNKTGRRLELRIEPGKVLVSYSTVLCTTITTLKHKHAYLFVGVDAGFSNYIRPAMYGAYQHFINLSNPEGEMQHSQIVGNVCETCDIFNKGIDLAEPREGDILAMLSAGGYGAAMSSNYNLRTTLPEVLFDNGDLKLIRKAQTYEHMMETFNV